MFWEDIAPGDVFDYGGHAATQDEIVAYARAYDPQPFHLDAEAAKDSLIGQLCASGWHVCALLSRMAAEAYTLEDGFLGTTQIEECRWRKPVFPDERLHVRRTCLEVAPAPERTDAGLCRFRFDVRNEAGDEKTRMTAWQMFRRRTEAGA